MSAHLEQLCRLMNPEGQDVVDVGAGDGAFAAALAGAGARVTGIEVSQARVEAANRAHAGKADFVQGRAEALPISDNSADLICFMFSMHHVPGTLQAAALDEALRVLRPGGRLHVVEPDTEGAMTSVVRLVDDETEVRNATAAFLDAAVTSGRVQELVRCHYDLVRRFASFDALAERVVLTDPARAEGFARHRDAMRAEFDRVAKPAAGGWDVSQPCTAYHLIAPSAG